VEKHNSSVQFSTDCNWHQSARSCFHLGMFGKNFLLQLQDLISKPDHVHFANFEDSFKKIAVMLYGKETEALVPPISFG
jgi:hypothetical protein